MLKSTKELISTFQENGVVSKEILQTVDALKMEINELIEHHYSFSRYDFLFFKEGNQGRNLHGHSLIKTLVRLKKSQPAVIRWIVNDLGVSSPEDAYTFSRVRLFLVIFFNHRKLKEYLTRRTVFDLANSSDEINTVQPGFFLDKRSKNFTSNKSILFSVYKIDSDHKISKLLKWNSDTTANFILAFPKLRELIPQLLITYPRLDLLFASTTLVSVTLHKNFKDTLDDLSENSISYQTAESVEVWHQRFLIQDGKLLITDETCLPSLSFVAGHWSFLNKTANNTEACLIKTPMKATRNMDIAIHLMGRADDNWYHFLLDTLPRFLFFEKIDEGVPILIRADIPQVAKDLVEKLIKRPIMYIEVEERLFVRKLHFLAARSSLFDGEECILRYRHSPKALSQLAKKILETQTFIASEIYDEKVFLMRSSSYRSLINLKFLMRISNYFGFKKISVNDNYYINQFKIFSEARIIISPGGAALANMIFMKPSSRIVILQSKFSAQFGFWKALAQSLNIQYISVTGFGTKISGDFQHKLHSNYIISPFKLFRILYKLRHHRK